MKSLLIGLLCVFGTNLVQAAPIFPLIEDFNTSANGWTNATNGAATWALGGPGGATDGYISLGPQTVDAQTIAVRATGVEGTPPTGASGGAFVGDWLAGGINEVSFWIRHNNGVPLAFAGRFSADSGRSMSAVSSLAVEPNTWTQVTLPIYYDAPGLTLESGTPTKKFFIVVASNMLSLQILPLSSISDVTIDVGSYSVSTAVPEPGTWAVLASAVMLGGVMLRRRRAK